MARRKGKKPTKAGQQGPDRVVATPLAVERRRNPRSLLLAAIAVLVCASGVGIAWVLHRSTEVVLPELPDLSDQPQAIVEHLREADEAARKCPFSADAIGALGMAYHSDLYYDEALQCYVLASELAPEDWRWKYYSVLLQGELGATQSVIETLRQIVVRNPDFPQAWLRLGDAALKQGQYEEAEAAYRSALAEDQDHPAASDEKLRSKPFPIRAYASFGLARLAMARAQPGEASRILEQVTEAHDKFGPAHRLLAEAYQKLGRDREAAQRIARAAACAAYQPPQDPMMDALARESCNSTFLLKRMDVAKLTDNGPWAERFGRRAMEVNPADREVPIQLARLMLTLGRADDAVSFVDHYRRIPGWEPEKVADACNSLGVAYGREGRFQEAVRYYHEAIRYYEETIRAKPDSARAYANLGLVCDQLGLKDKALEYYREAVRVQPSDADAQTRLAMVLFNLGRLEQAQHHVAAALELSPYHAPARNLLGAIAFSNGQSDEAEKHFRDAIRYAPNHVLAWCNLGMLLERKGRWAEAAECYRDGLKELPEDLRLASAARQKF